MSQEISSLEQNTTKAYKKLIDNMPPIGFFSRKKRLKAYMQITEITEYMISSKEINEETALFVLSIMMRKCASFQKAATMTALCLNDMAKNALSPIGLKFILEVRRNLNLPLTQNNEEEATSAPENANTENN